MIIKELYELYKRLVADGIDEVAQYGWTRRKIEFRIVIKDDGTLVRISKTKAVDSASMGVRTSGDRPFFLCDTAEYLLGVGGGDIDQTRRRHELSIKKHQEVAEALKGTHYEAVCKFFQTWEVELLESVLEKSHLKKADLKSKSFGVFRIQNSDRDVHHEPLIKTWWETEGYKQWSGKKLKKGMCLVTGETLPIEDVHPIDIQKVSDKKAKLVANNCKSFESYGKTQCLNAPISTKVAHGHASALNYLITATNQSLRIGKDTIVFWTDAPSEKAPEYNSFMMAVLEPEKSQDPVVLAKVQAWLNDIARGVRPLNVLDVNDWEKTRFFVLGLSPNSARIYVRFFYQSTLADWSEHISSHFHAMELCGVGGSANYEKITPKQIIAATEPECKSDRVLPSSLYIHSLINSIFNGSRYSDSIATNIIRRIRVGNGKKSDKQRGNKGRCAYMRRWLINNYVRCAFLKAWLIRRPTHYKLEPMLDSDNTQQGYILGRLFAVLVEAQLRVLPNLNRTIRDTYFGRASTSPGSVFPVLIRLHQHHLKAMDRDDEYKRARLYFEKTVLALMAHLSPDSSFPMHLSLEEQGLFDLGFYHQTLSSIQKLTSKHNNEQN